MGPSPRAALWRKAGTPFPGITFPSFALLLSVLVWAPSGSSPSLSPLLYCPPPPSSSPWRLSPSCLKGAGSGLISPCLSHSSFSMKCVDTEVQESMGARLTATEGPRI